VTVFSATVVVAPASVCVVVTVTVTAFGLTGTIVMPANALDSVCDGAYEYRDITTSGSPPAEDGP